MKPATRMPVRAPPDPPTQLLQTLFWMILGAASWLFTQKALVVPVTVMFEKLLLLCVRVLVVALPPVVDEAVNDAAARGFVERADDPRCW